MLSVSSLKHLNVTSYVLEFIVHATIGSFIRYGEPSGLETHFSARGVAVLYQLVTLTKARAYAACNVSISATIY